MKTIGIIAEYNPFHLGHAWHIEESKRVVGGECAVVCVMSGNYVQRGDVAVFAKHTRALAALSSGADLVIELPVPYSLCSAEGFARAGVYLLDRLGICDYISFGSESGDAALLKTAAEIITSEDARTLIKSFLGEGLPYASALQKTADSLMGDDSGVFESPNNLLGIEYMKALSAFGSPLEPITVTRLGGAHDGSEGYSATAVRQMLARGKEPRGLMPETAFDVCKNDIAAGRGPVFLKSLEPAILSRLRCMNDFSNIQGVSEGIERRFLKYAKTEAGIEDILKKVKCKRYPLSRIRRLLLCACLAITTDMSAAPPPYIRILAMNRKGMELMKKAKDCAGLPIITKPVSSQKLPERAAAVFRAESAATDLYVLGFQNETKRRGGQEWTQSPVCLTVGVGGGGLLCRNL